ncbi:MAG: c-type cytochrome [Actinobacteria bacterium]|nr:c-type cytochrome [Actinomycetota bacterium]
MTTKGTTRRWMFAVGAMAGVALTAITLGFVVMADDAPGGDAAGPGAAPAETTAAPTFEGTVDDRPVAEFFLDTCSGCHGADRRGATGPALLPERLSQPDEYYTGVISGGKPGTVMPSFASAPYDLSDEDIATLVGFIRSESGEGPPEWTLADMEASLTVLVDESTLPTAPTHGADLDNLMLITERETQSIAVVDGDRHELIGKIPASYRAHGYTFSPVDPRWAYNMGRDGWVFKIDLYGLQPVRKVRIGLDSRAIAMSDDGNYLIAGNYVPATLVMLDAHTLEPLKVWSTTTTGTDGEITESRVATILDVAPDLVGPYFVVALKEAGQVWRIDWSQPDFPVTATLEVGRILHDGFLSPDNRTFYLASQTDNWMAAIDVETMQVVERIETGDTPHPGSGAAWEYDGVTYGATVHAAEGKVTVWDLDTNTIVGTVPTAGAGLFLRAHHDSPYVWADAVFAEEPHTITVFDKAPPFQLIGEITDGVRTLHPEFTADGKAVYVSDWDGHVVRVYDAVTLELIAEIDGIDNPTGIFNTSRRLETLGH